MFLGLTGGESECNRVKKIGNYLALLEALCKLAVAVTRT